MPKPPPPRLASRPLTNEQRIEHFRGAEALLAAAIESGKPVTLRLRSSNPVTREHDEWLLWLNCVPLLDVTHVEWFAAFWIGLSMGGVREHDPCDWDYYDGDDDACYDDCEIVDGERWAREKDTIASDREVPPVTAVFATWLLRSGWIFVDGRLFEHEVVDGEYTWVGINRLMFYERVRLHGTPSIAAPHWQRANQEREVRRERSVESSVESSVDRSQPTAYETFLATYKEEDLIPLTSEPEPPERGTRSRK